MNVAIITLISMMAAYEIKKILLTAFMKMIDTEATNNKEGHRI
jgi:hypothetical protein